MKRRLPTYSSAVRMARLVYLLSQAWRPIPLEELAEHLNVSNRTLLRYRKALNDGMGATEDELFIRVVKEGKRECWAIADEGIADNATYYKIVSVIVSKLLFKSLSGTVLEYGMGAIHSMLADGLPPSKKIQLETLGNKIRHTGFGGRDYSGHDAMLSSVLRGLIHNRKLKIHHYSSKFEKTSIRIIHPYTLLFHRDSLYLHSHDEKSGEIRTFAVERIRDAELLEDTFIYPKHFDPDKIISGSLGIFEKKGTKPNLIHISFNEILWEYITTRNWHKSQRFTKPKDKWFTMELMLTNTEELIPWILQFGDDALVVEPEALRKELKAKIGNIAGLYE